MKVQDADQCPWRGLRPAVSDEALDQAEQFDRGPQTDRAQLSTGQWREIVNRCGGTPNFDSTRKTGVVEHNLDVKEGDMPPGRLVAKADPRRCRWLVRRPEQSRGCRFRNAGSGMAGKPDVASRRQ
jgi:hypothetical protein